MGQGLDKGFIIVLAVPPHQKHHHNKYPPLLRTTPSPIIFLVSSHVFAQAQEGANNINRCKHAFNLVILCQNFESIIFTVEISTIS